MEQGDLFHYETEVLEVCHSEKNSCDQCYGFNRQQTCFSLPECTGKKYYFRRLTPYEVRKAKGEKRLIHTPND